jgi:hypothetical protein
MTRVLLFSRDYLLKPLMATIENQTENGRIFCATQNILIYTLTRLCHSDGYKDKFFNIVINMMITWRKSK